MSELIKNADKQRIEMNSAQQKQLSDLKKANFERIKEMVKHWADEGKITRDGASKVLMALDKIYGLGGAVDTLMDEFKSRVSRNARITIAIETAMSDNYLTPPTEEDERRRRGERRYATGGLEIANKPTKAIFGEAGPEAALFMPTTGSFSLNEFANMIGRQRSGPGGSSNMNVRVDVKADAHFNNMFEDQLMDRIADVVTSALPGVTVTKR